MIILPILYELIFVQGLPYSTHSIGQYSILGETYRLVYIIYMDVRVFNMQRLYLYECESVTTISIYHYFHSYYFH